MKEIPTLFSTPMVQATLAGMKTMTRRIIKTALDDRGLRFTNRWEDWHGKEVNCRYGSGGDLLYVRETWFPAAINGNKVLVGYHDKDPDHTHEFTTEKIDFYWKQLDKARMIPSIHMPKEAARIWLEVADIRVERLQDISEEDAKAEGVEMNRDGSWHDYLEPDRLCQDSAKASFQSLWMKINGPESWDANPWVWCVSYKVLSTTGKPELKTSHSIPA